MHYYNFNIGDYRRRTNNFTLLEHGIYRQLIDEYYLDEFPLPADLKKLYRKIGAKSEEEKQVVKELLDDFFKLNEDGYYHEHCTEIISEYHAKSLINKENGKKGGRPKKNPEESEKNPVGYEGLPNANRTESEQNPNQELLTNNQEPITILKNSENSPSSSPVPYAKIVNLYHELLPMLPKVQTLTTKRKGQINQRWKSKQLPDLETWKEYFEHVSESKFLMGLVQPINGRKVFKADIEWLTNETNFVKVWENKYHG